MPVPLTPLQTDLQQQLAALSGMRQQLEGLKATFQGRADEAPVRSCLLHTLNTRTFILAKFP